ncbi:hypothetical protein MiSe_78550 [Microseira wollei NIES-4236]|uniref:Uncharacterized protein n=1 Tax=Microseira wollei NIES-4236 TaxID=2530354 RepID=A0AAV3XPG6_9CYAN|nr:hypothetical protein MiSe_78550 [Microseira wollei NIES-4236]
MAEIVDKNLTKPQAVLITERTFCYRGTKIVRRNHHALVANVVSPENPRNRDIKIERC